MSGAGWTAYAPPVAARIELTAGGTPTGAQLAALTAAVDAVLAAGAPAADPLPAAYRSRWRRATLVENTEVPVGIKDNGAPWGGMA